MCTDIMNKQYFNTPLYKPIGSDKISVFSTLVEPSVDAFTSRVINPELRTHHGQCRRVKERGSQEVFMGRVELY